MWVVCSIHAQQYIVQLTHLNKPNEIVLRLTNKNMLIDFFTCPVVMRAIIYHYYHYHYLSL